ncbi:MAG: hypothetical protein ACJ0FJ_04260 [Gammaproteobacteria bacterium]|jgi:hypothetical protein|tara:strand:- start:222 stop:596 length:375 start_codon:yes stop_codon:yes gene_type:complete
MALVYGLIGGWAILDPLAAGLDLGWPSFMEAVGLSVTSSIGYSEIAGIYGGLNLCIGIMCLIGIFKKDIGIFSIKLITFLVGSIAFGRVLFSMLPTTPSFYNSFFVFEVSALVVGLFLLYFQKD